MEKNWIVPVILVVVLLGLIGGFKLWPLSPVPVFFIGLLVGRYWWPYCRWHNKG